MAVSSKHSDREACAARLKASFKRSTRLKEFSGSPSPWARLTDQSINSRCCWSASADQLTAVAEKLRPLGMFTGYHNHQTEWPLVEGKRPMDVLAAGTPKHVMLQLDVGTCVQAGADPVAWINANPGRINSIHCKDWGAGAGRGYGVVFGEGDSPWSKIFEAAEAAEGVEYYLIEQEQSPPNEQLQMAERCLANWKKMRG